MTGGSADLHRVAVLATSEVMSFDLGIAERVFSAAKDRDGRPRYEVAICTPDGHAVPTSAGYRLLPEHGPEAIEWAETVVVPTPSGSSALVDGKLERDIGAALGRASDSVRLLSICTGAFVLAAARLLDKRPATTHWAYAKHFRELFPEVEIKPDVLFTDDHDILTSAGAAAGIDLCLHVVRKDCGSEIANRAARSCVVSPWREGGQAQYIEQPIPSVSGPSTGATRTWALQQLHRPLDLPSLAAHARTSVRTFTRRFRAETGVSPTRWLLQQRIGLARHLLETTDMTVDRIAREAGFGTGTTLRQRMHDALEVSPSAYRRAFHHERRDARADRAS